VAIEQVRHRGIGIAVVAQGPEILFAKETPAAGDRKGDNDAVALFEFVHFAADVDHFAHEFVAKNVSRLHGGDEAVEEMQVRTANGGACNADNRIAGVQDARVRDRIHVDAPGAFPANCFHLALSWS